MLKGVLLGLVLLFAIEPTLIHILLAAKLKGIWKIAFHLGLVISEIYLLEILIGNLYYLQFSEVFVGSKSLAIDFGLLWKVNIDYSNIELIELGNHRQIGDKTPKITLLNSPVVRLHFKKNESAQRMFKIVSLKSIDLYLNESDITKLQRNSSSENQPLECKQL